MHPALFAIGVALLLAACDPVVSSTLRLPPAAAVRDTVTARAGDARSEALAAVEQLALAFGLRAEAEVSKGCIREWRSGPSGERSMRLHLCASADTQGGLDIQLSEYITSRWSPRGDSLRRALADTLARFGVVQSR